MSNASNRRVGNTRNIFEQDDFPNLVGGLIPLENNTHYIIKASPLILTDSFDLSNISGFTIFEGGGVISHSGSDTLFQGNLTGTFILRENTIIGDGTADIWDLTGNDNPSLNVLIVSPSLFSNFSGAGSLNSLGSLLFDPSFYNEVDSALVINDCGILSMINVPFTGTGSGTPKIVLNGTFINGSISNAFLNLPNGDSFLKISPDILILGKFVINNNTFNAATGDFFTPQLTGSITTFADNGSGGTTVTTSVAHGITQEQKIIITGTTNYNNTFTISAASGSVFDINTAFVADDATGSYDTGDSSLFLDNNAFDFESNGDQINTNEIGKITVNNSFVVTITTIDTPVELNGGGTDWTGDIERRFEFEAAGENDGTLKYTGIQTKEFRIAGKVSFDASGGSSRLLTAYIGLNGSIISNSGASLEQARQSTVYPSTIIQLSEDDVLSLFVENNDGTQDITIFTTTDLETFSV